MKSHFQKSLDFVLWWETGGGDDGAYHLDPNDPGGATKWGISQKAYPDLDIKNISRHGAEAIYERDYWRTSKCHELPFPLNMVVFDASVNVGVGRSIKFLQSAAKVNTDGVIGPITLMSIDKRWHKNPSRFMAKVMAYRLKHYHVIAGNGLGQYFHNWSRRTMELAILAGQSL